MNKKNLIGRVTSCLALLLITLPAQADSGTELHQFFDDVWERELAQQPLFASNINRHEYEDRLPDVSPENLARRAEYWRSDLERLDRIDVTSLAREDQVSAALFRQKHRLRLRGFELHHYELAMGTQEGFLFDLLYMVNKAPRASEADYLNYLARLEAIPDFLEQNTELMRAGLKRGMTQPREIMGEIEAIAAEFLVEDPHDSVFWQPFAEMPASIPATQRQVLSERGYKMIEKTLLPQFRRTYRFITEEYTPGSSDSLAASDLPGGADYYNYLIERHTTLPLDADTVHQRGLQEVARIRQEMLELVQGLKFSGSLTDFIEYLRNAEQFYVQTPGELLRHAAWLSKKIDGELPRLFATLPRQPYSVKPVPAALAPTYTSGRYVDGAAGTESGTYWVNTHDLPNRPLYGLPALTAHEAVPGHHLQFALAAELDALPSFRGHAEFTAFTEGWALYAEHLGLEMGLYDDPYDDFGRLTFEMWRACRLVVDTGIHAKGWTRQRAIDYMASHTALSMKDIQVEVDRYISWPGQALGYKIGELKIRELRTHAEQQLGARFDLRLFHDRVLSSGPVSMTVLEQNIELWIKQQGTDK